MPSKDASLFGKALQRRLYSLLLDKTTVLTFVAVAGLVFVSFLQFGQVWLQWSSDKYEAVFNSFSDNLLGRSLQSRLCQYVPVDVVYTWVNGSDPVFLDDLKHAQENRLARNPDHRPLKGCPYDHCVPSNMLALDRVLGGGDGGDGAGAPKTSHTVSMVVQQNPHLHSLQQLIEPRLVCGHYQQNRTLLLMTSVSDAERAANASSTLGLGLQLHPIQLAYWSTDWTAPNSFPMAGFFMLTDLPATASEAKLRHILPLDVSDVTLRLWHYPEQRVAVFQGSNATKIQAFVDDHRDLALGAGGGGEKVRVWAAHLVVELPAFADHKAFQPNRYADYEQLRYSIRSVEKYAPWVRHIYLVTNGQIPHWLNLDHPKLTLVTHEEIFEDTRNLPTFSSPAIEANIHRIPGLSDKFLYLNDDVMFGKEVWPEDFFTGNGGHKVRLAWPLPDCSPSCPYNWVHDGFCDKACNTSACMFDGGDCLGENPRIGFGYQEEDHAFRWGNDREDEALCSSGCLDNWLADNFCDDSCNVPSCGFDAGDCGVDQFSNFLHEVPFQYNSSWPTFRFHLPDCSTVAFWNMSRLFLEFEDVGLEPQDHHAVRSVSLSDSLRVMTMLLHANVTEASLNMTVQAKKEATVAQHQFVVTCNSTRENQTSQFVQDILNKVEDGAKMPEPGDDLPDLEQVDEHRLNLTEHDQDQLEDLKRQLIEEEITTKGFNLRRNKLLLKYVRRYLVNGGSLSQLILGADAPDGHKRALLSVKEDLLEHVEEDGYDDMDLPPQAPVGDGAGANRDQPLFGQHSLLDAYGDSLLHVNRLYTAHYGHAQRKVPAHMPHFVDKHIVARMHQAFPDSWTNTSRSAFRSSRDMQFAFSYYHFLMQERSPFDAADVFDEFDTDDSATWSDREIRTLLARIYSLPLYLETVRAFEDVIVNCSRALPADLSAAPAPAARAYERYYDSQLPLVTRQLIQRCDAMVDLLGKHFRDRPRYRFQLLDERDVAMKRLTSNVSHVVRELDDLRKKPRKFVCLNDDTDANRAEDNRLVQSILIDFFESVLPVPSSFELPAEYRNKFTHVAELKAWQFYRTLLHVATYACVAGLLFMLVTGYWGIDVNELLAYCLPRWWMAPASNNERPKKFNV